MEQNIVRWTTIQKSLEIKRFEFIRATKSRLYYFRRDSKGNLVEESVAKATYFCRHHYTWEEARDFIQSGAEEGLRLARESVANHEQALATIMAMENPAGTVK